MKLIPQPKVLLKKDGMFCLTYRHPIVMAPQCPPEILDSAQLLAKEIEECTGFSLMICRRKVQPEDRCIYLDYVSGEDSPESYQLEIQPNRIRICGGAVGLLYGVQTLRQLIRQYGGLIPCAAVTDSPDLKARGLFYDVTRGRIPTLAFLKELADKCSFYKLNQLHLYIEHSFLFEGLSEVWRDDTPLTARDILELDAYCRKLHVELVPSIATLGHLYKVLRSKSFHHLSEIEEGDAEFSFYRRMEHHTLDVTQEESLQLVYRMIDEYVPLFTSGLFNINGDEVFDLGKGRGKALADEIGAHRMYVDWIGKIADYVKKLGKRPMFWGDVILEDPESISALPKDIICMNWDYAPEYCEDHARKLAEAGANQYLCPGLQGWKQTINLFDTAYRNLHKMATLAYKFGGEGLLVTEWGDFGHLQDPESAMPGIAYAGAMAWNRDIPDMQTLNEAVSVLEYGDPTGRIMWALTELSDQVIMNWGQIVEYCEITWGRLREDGWGRFREYYEQWITERLTRAKEIDGRITDIQKMILGIMPTMGERKRMLPYFVMSEGQRLFNRFALWLAGTGEDPGALACDLEIWYQDYKNLWRRSSRESELYRIGELIFWMADHLRTGK